MTGLKLPDDVRSQLRCPGHPDIPLQYKEGQLVANVNGTTLVFPVINGTPILINENNSVFFISDFLNRKITTMDLRDHKEKTSSFYLHLKKIVLDSMPSKSRSIGNFTVQKALDRVEAAINDPRVLVLGAGDIRYRVNSTLSIVYTDVALAHDTHLIADAHDIPFADGTFDAVIAVAVLEHVVDPYRCVEEVQRVLRPDGFVFAITPFMQQVHMGAYDFTRFTALGHRRLFRYFESIEEGIANGPGMALAWSIDYYVSLFSYNRQIKYVLQFISRLICRPLLWFDHLFRSKARSYDCASAFYFFGRLGKSPISDRDILKQYRRH